MAKKIETFAHTADIGLRATADTVGELYEALGEGLAEVICPRSQVQNREGKAIDVESDDPESLAVDFLSRLLRLCMVDRFRIAEVHATSATEKRIQAVVLGEKFDVRRHEGGSEVKAVTYHMLHVAQEGGQWVAQVVLDV